MKLEPAHLHSLSCYLLWEFFQHYGLINMYLHPCRSLVLFFFSPIKENGVFTEEISGRKAIQKNRILSVQSIWGRSWHYVQKWYIIGLCLTARPYVIELNNKQTSRNSFMPMQYQSIHTFIHKRCSASISFPFIIQSVIECFRFIWMILNKIHIFHIRHQVLFHSRFSFLAESFFILRSAFSCTLYAENLRHSASTGGKTVKMVFVWPLFTFRLMCVIRYCSKQMQGFWKTAIIIQGNTNNKGYTIIWSSYGFIMGIFGH